MYGERLLEVHERLIHATLLLVQVAQLAERQTFVAAVADLAVYGERLPAVRARLIHPALLHLQETPAGKNDPLTTAVTDLAGDGKRLLKVGARLLYPARPLACPPQFQSRVAASARGETFHL